MYTSVVGRVVNPRSFEEEIFHLLEWEHDTIINTKYATVLWDVSKYDGLKRIHLNLRITEPKCGFFAANLSISESGSFEILFPKTVLFEEILLPKTILFETSSETENGNAANGISNPANLRDYARFVRYVDDVSIPVARSMYGQFDSLYESIIEAKLT